MDRLKTAAQTYFHDERFTDFTIVCGEKEYKVHRCFVSAHSKWFETCCSGLFAETPNRRVELKEDPPEAVDRMIQYFYTFDYKDAPDLGNPKDREFDGKEPRSSIQLHAWVYAVADKYDVPDLKTAALNKFRAELAAGCEDWGKIIFAASTVYNDILLHESDRHLHEAVLDAWVMAGSTMPQKLSPDILTSFNAETPRFATDFQLWIMKGLSAGNVKSMCSSCRMRTEWARKSFGGPTCRGCGGIPVKEDITITSNVIIKKFG